MKRTVNQQAVLGAVWAQSLNAVIGRDGTMPWYAPEDLAHFKEVTVGAPVIMGRKTWDSFPEKYRPLPDRMNIVVSSRVQFPTPAAGALWVPSFDAALEIAVAESDFVWLIGGATLFNKVLQRTDLPAVEGGQLSVVERSVFDAVVEGDTFAPDLGADWHLADTTDYSPSAKGWIQAHADGEKQDFSYRFETWRRETP